MLRDLSIKNSQYHYHSEWVSVWGLLAVLFLKCSPIDITVFILSEWFGNKIVSLEDQMSDNIERNDSDNDMV